MLRDTLVETLVVCAPLPVKFRHFNEYDDCEMTQLRSENTALRDTFLVTGESNNSEKFPFHHFTLFNHDNDGVGEERN